MGTPILDRDRVPGGVFERGRMALIGSTYHRTAGRPEACPVRLRTAVRSTARGPGRMLAAIVSLLAACAIASPAAGAATLVIEGAGEGHGVGMSQDGALGYARHGYSYQQILAHYYTGTSIGLAPPNTVVRVLVGAKVKRVQLERYVRGVVSAEVSPSWPPAVLEAQAVASRTYALTAHAGGSRFDVYADTRSQVYRGAAAETPATNAAVAATAGQIVLYAGAPAITYFFASSGGMTENVEYGFPGAEAQPWLRGVPDAYEGASSKWTLNLSFSSAAHRLKGLFKGSFRGVEVLKRAASPRILSARVLGSAAASVVGGPQLAGRLGLGSTWEYFSVRSGASVKPEPDRSGQSRPGAHPAPAPTTPARSAPPTGSQGGVSPIQSVSAAGATNGSGGTSPGG
jgi:SpoIID/LytB domain protein